MSKTVQEIMEVMGKTAEASVALERKNGSSYTHIADINPEDINEARYYFDGALYRSVMRCLELKLKNNWTAKAKKGLLLDGFNIKVTHPEGDSVTIGYGGFYIAEEPEYDAAQNLTSIIAYDELYPSMQAYDMNLDWTNGITLKNYLIAILNNLGINYDVQSLNLMANADKVITSEKFLDIGNDSTESAYTYRDVLDEIAKAAGVTFAFRNSLRGDEYKLYAIKPTESGYVIDESNLRSVTIGAKYGPVKGVVLSREPQEDNVFYPSNLSSSQTAVKIANVEIIEDAKDNDYRENFIEGIYNSVKNTEYYLYELDSFGMAFLNFGDIFTIKTADRENGIIGEEKEYKTIFMRTDMTIGNGIKEKSKLEAPQATSTDYSAAKSSTEKMLKWTMLRVDKQNQRIESYITDNDSRYTKITQTLEGLDVAINDEKNGLKAQMTATAEKAKSAYSMASTVINAGYTTTDDVNTLIAQSANDITLSVERNLKIGARNILLDSARFGSFTPTGEQAGVKVTPFDDPAVPSGVYSNVRFNSQINGTVDFYYSAADILQSLKKIKANTTYTLSFFARYKSGIDDIKDFAPKSVISAGSATVTYDNDRCTTPKLSTAWQRYILTFKLTGTASDFRLRFLFNNCKPTDVSAFQLSSLKLEEGNVATDWTPSEIDMVSDATYQSFIKLLPDKISAGVESTVTDQYVADKINQKCVSVTLGTSGVTIENGALILKDENGNSMIDSSGVHSEHINFGNTINIDTIKNGTVIDNNDVDVLTLRNYTGSDTGMVNAKAAVSAMSAIPVLKALFWNNSKNWFCHKTATNSITIAEIDNVEETQVYMLTFDVILATTTNGKALLPQQVGLTTDKTVTCEIGVDTLTAGKATVSGKTYQYRYGSLSCSIRGYDLIKIKKANSQNAKLRIFSIAMANQGTSSDSLSWLQAMNSPTADHMGFVGNFKLTTFVGATLNARALLNSNTNYYFDLGTGILAADEISCKNLRSAALPSAQSTDDLKKVFIDPSTGQLYREL